MEELILWLEIVMVVGTFFFTYVFFLKVITHFRAKANQPLAKLMKTYCTKENMTMNSVLFSFEVLIE
jgi:hypothetical protein